VLIPARVLALVLVLPGLLGILVLARLILISLMRLLVLAGLILARLVLIPALATSKGIAIRIHCIHGLFFNSSVIINTSKKI
jgi:hypothetical protein